MTSELPGEDSTGIKRRAAGGVMAYVFRGVVGRVLGFVATIVLTRYLAPDELGVVALGQGVVVMGGALSSGGLAASLIRREAPPTRYDLQVALGWPLLGTLILTAVVAVVGVSLAGEQGALVAVMVLSLPLVTLRIPVTITAQRALNFTPIVQNELTELLIFHLLTISLLVAGFGPWAVAVALVVRALLATALLLARLDPGLLRPRFDWATMRPMLRFGLQFQALGLVNSGREQGLNFLIAGLTGTTALGLWNLVSRLLQPIYILYQALYRVQFTALARLIESGQAVGPLMRRGLALTAVGSGLVLVPLAASSQALVPSAFGGRWIDAAPVLSLMCAAFMINGPSTTCTIGLLLARGEPQQVLRNVLISSGAWLVMSVTVLPWLGILGVAMTCLVAASIDLVLMSRSMNQFAGVRTYTDVMGPCLAGVLAGTAGWLLCGQLGTSLVAAFGAAGASTAAFLSILALLRPADLSDFGRLLRRYVRVPGFGPKLRV